MNKKEEGKKEEDDDESGEQQSIFKGLSAAQKKKLKAKMKADAEKAAAGTKDEIKKDQTQEVKEESKVEANPPKDSEANKNDEDDEGEDDQQSIFKGLSAAQKKKLKAKMKADAEKAAAASGIKADEGEDEKKDAKGKKGKKTGNSALAAKIREQQAAKEAAKAEQERIEREEQEKWEREEKERLEAIEREKKAKKDVKMQKKAKIEELKKQGLYMTTEERARKEAALARRAEMGVTTEDNNGGKVSTVIRKRKNKKEETKEQNEQTIEDKIEVESEDEKPVEKKVQKVVQEVVNEEEQQDFEDWEDAVDEIADKIVSKTKETHVIVANESSDEEQVQTSTKSKEESKSIKNATKIVVQAAQASAFDANDDDQAAIDRRERQKKLLAERKKLASKKNEKEKKLRCPIVCIMGHVDTGKTLILDKLRKTNVQAGEAGGITQQIGATYFPMENLQSHLNRINHLEPMTLEIPGFLVIDTPGHESFTNLRSRGSSLCDLAVLVVDIMHGLEQQTLESIQMLRSKNTPFCIALNKIDRLNTWKPNQEMNTRDTLSKQTSQAQSHFETQLKKTILAFNEIGLNVQLYWLNESVEDTLSFCPTSAITGEGLSDLMYYLCKMGQTSEREKLIEKEVFECTVLEVKVIEGHGTTIDVVLVNGLLKVGDTIVISGLNGPIVTSIRALLTPQPMKEMRVKGEYIHHQKIKGSMGIKISAPGMENALAGSELFKCSNEHEIEDAKIAIEGDINDILDKYVDKTKDGVIVQASTIGSLEALLEFLSKSKIPVTSVNIGPVHKKDILKAVKAISNEKQLKEYATLLAFDVRVMPEAQQYAEENGVKIFTANIIYHLFDSFTEYLKQCKEERKLEDGTKAVFPCILEMVKDACFNTKSPIIIGVNVIEGVLKIGTPICVPDKENLKLGIVTSIELNKKPITQARASHGSVAIKITNDGSVQYGRHFDESNQIVSLISRDSIDVLKQNYREEMTKDDWVTVLKLKKIFGIY